MERIFEVSFSPLRALVRQFQSFSGVGPSVLFGSASRHSQPWKQCSDEILLDQLHIFESLKAFIITVCPKKSTKVSEDGKLTVKRGRTLSSLLK